MGLLDWFKPKSIDTHVFIQLTPIPEMEVIREGDTLKIPPPTEEAQQFVAQECEAFAKWVGGNQQETIRSLDILPGYPSLFLLISSDEGAQESLCSFFSDISSACVFGDKGAIYYGQSFNKRARWCRRLD